METKTILQELTHMISQNISKDISNLKPFKNYSEQDLSKATYIYINSHDANWQLGFEPDLEIPKEAWDHLDHFLEYPNMAIIPIFLY